VLGEINGLTKAGCEVTFSAKPRTWLSATQRILVAVTDPDIVGPPKGKHSPHFVVSKEVQKMKRVYLSQVLTIFLMVLLMPASVMGQNPSIEVIKFTQVRILNQVRTVTYQYHVFNTGNVTLTGISLSDDNDNDDANCPETTLEPGEMMDTCWATHTFTQAELDANGSPTAGSGVLSNTVTASSNESSDATSFLSIPIVPELTCYGFMPPFDQSLSLKQKVKRAIPVDMVLVDADGYTVTDADIAAPPVINVYFEGHVFGETPPDTDDLLPLGSANDDNIFRFDIVARQWIYNLGTKQFTAAGTYTVMVDSGDTSEYTINGPDGACLQTFERLP
jgi:hypothetical protein